eukprot:SAG25_NODE_20_length_23237_cov_58.179229_21_plen_46_part_00
MGRCDFNYAPAALLVLPLVRDVLYLREKVESVYMVAQNTIRRSYW